MQIEYAAFTFVFTLAAVVNGLGIVRWLSALAEFMRKRASAKITVYGTFLIFASFQFLLHVLLWWSLWAVRVVEDFNFLDFLYLLTGPILLFLSSSLLIPDAVESGTDQAQHFTAIRKTYATMLAAVWLWALFLWPVLLGVVPPSMPFHATFLVLAIALRFVSNPKAVKVIGLLNWVVLVVFVSRFSMQLGGISGHL